MEYWKYRHSTLQIINSLFLVTMAWFGYICLSDTELAISELLIALMVGIFLQGMLLIMSLFQKIKLYYQTILSISIWFITIFMTDLCIWAGYQHTQLFLFLFLLLAIFSVFNRKIIQLAGLMYLASVLPVIFISTYEREEKSVFFGIVFILMFLAFLKSTYEFKLFKAYENSNKYQFFLLENALEAFALHEIILDEQGKAVDYRFLEVNKAFETLTGMCKEQLIQKSVLTVMPETEHFWIEQYGEVVLKGIQKTIINYAKYFDKWFEVTAYPVSKTQFVVMFADITEKREDHRKLINAIKISENSIQLKNQFLRDVNHRLRTPLNGMMGMMQLIDTEELGGDNKELFETMALEMKHSRNIINQISKYVEIQNKQLNFRRYIVFELITNELAELNCDNSIVTCMNKSIQKMSYFLEKSILTSVFKELMTNAILHTHDNEVEVEVDLHTTESANQELLLSIAVTDFGEGMDQDKLKFVFNEFYHHDFISIYREDDRISLPMCKQLLKSCGGDLSVTSKVGVASTFVMTLPVYMSDMTNNATYR